MEVFNKEIYNNDMTQLAIILFFADYLPEDSRKRPKHVGGLSQVFILLYLTIVRLLEYVVSRLTAWNMDNIKFLSVLCGYNKCLRLRKEYRRSVFEYRVLRKIFGCKKDVVRRTDRGYLMKSFTICSPHHLLCKRSDPKYEMSGLYGTCGVRRGVYRV